MKGNSLFARSHERCEIFPGKHLDQIARQLRNTRRFLRVAQIVAQEIAVLFYHHPAATCGNDNGVAPRLKARPPGVDVASREVESFLRGGEVVAQCTATTHLSHLDS